MKTKLGVREMASQNPGPKANIDYINELVKELETINTKNSCAYRFLQNEIHKFRTADNNESLRRDGHIDLHNHKFIRLKAKVHIPIEEAPHFNFVGKLLGPKGSSLQQLQEATQTRMAVLGRGSMWDKKKEEEFRKQGDPKYSHLNENLHVEVSVFAPPAEAHRRMAAAMMELEPFLVPDAPPGGPPPYFEDMRHMPPNPPPYHHGEPPMPPPSRGGPPAQRKMGGPPPSRGGDREAPPRRRSPMVQSTYSSPPEPEDWGRPPASRQPRGGSFNSTAPPAPAPRSSVRQYDEQPNDYNNFGDNYGEYNSSRNSSSYYDYPQDPEPVYRDGFNDEPRGPMRTGGGGTRPSPRSDSRAQSHPYAGATRRY